MSKDENIDKIFLNKFRADKRIGEGSYGEVYLGVHIFTNEKVALKLENSENQNDLLEEEFRILESLNEVGFPRAISYGKTGRYNVLVMELLGQSLEDLFSQKSNRFSLKTVCMIAIQALDRLEYLHSKYLVHRDLKPNNFVIGLDSNQATIHLIDFGLSKNYRNPKTLKHIEKINNKNPVGTARYSSIDALAGYTQSRKDDLESLAYILIYFLKGRLPWQGMDVSKENERNERICNKKIITSSQELCKDLPPQFQHYLNYSKKLKFEEDPDYDLMRKFFETTIYDKKLSYDLKFEWIKDQDMSLAKAKSSYSVLDARKLTKENSRVTTEKFKHKTTKSVIELDKTNTVKSIKKIYSDKKRQKINTKKEKTSHCCFA